MTTRSRSPSDESGAPVTRIEHNCAECRRLKVKCDRRVPCSGCVKRGCSELCPYTTLDGGRRGAVIDRQELLRKVARLEAELVAEREALASAVRQLSHLPSSLTIASTTTAGAGAAAPTSALPLRLNALNDSSADETRTESSGTLVQAAGGQYKFIGPSAGPPWLREDTLKDISGPPSPHRHPVSFSFPIEHSSDAPSYHSLREYLSSHNDVHVLVDSYYRNISWNGTPIARKDFDVILHRQLSDDIPRSEILATQELSLVYAVMGLGTLLNQESQPYDPEAYRLLGLAQRSLSAGRFVVVNTMTSLQALMIMAKIATYSDLPRRLDLAWQMWGMAARIMQAMGLHRDGGRWNLDEREVEQRRMVFWELYTTDIFNSRTWDRPNAIAANQCDTLYPRSWVVPNRDFDAVRADLARLAKEWAAKSETRADSRVVDESLCVAPAGFAAALEIWRRICEFERNVPFHLRCRASLKAMVSAYSSDADVEADSPPPSRSDMTLSLRQHNLTMNICGTVYQLLRPYFVAAIREHPREPTASPHAQAFLAVFERSSMTVAMLNSIYSFYPRPALRHHFFWSSTFSAAACLATVCIASPTCSVADAAMRDIELLFSLLTAARDSMPASWFRRDVDWFVQLRNKALTAKAQAQSQSHMLEVDNGPSPETDAELEIVGWRTKLVKRSERVEDDSSQSQQPWTITSNMEAQTAADGAVNGMSAEDWLEQFLAETVGQGPPPRLDDDAFGDIFDFNNYNLDSWQ